MITMHKKISLRLDADLADRLQDRADRERVPLSYVLRHLVIRFLGEPPAGGSAAGACPPHRRTPPEVLKTRAEQLQDEFQAEVCKIFDGFRAQGHDMKEAAKRTNFALKAKNHPWATYEIVADVLRKSGRFRKPKARP